MGTDCIFCIFRLIHNLYLLLQFMVIDIEIIPIEISKILSLYILQKIQTVS